ncbi:MAG: SHOCT domain-containing protein [Anaerolineae bacterium]|nr:SHOCT domain-containing protein [Anaerolineae bacterium]
MMMGFGLVLLLLVGGGLIVTFLGARTLAPREGQVAGWADAQPRRTSRQILDERLARGEIAVDEYEQLRTRIQD